MEWRIDKTSVDYLYAVDLMEKRVEGIYKNECDEMFWFLEHPDIYTSGTSADISELIEKKRFPVYKTGRGGRFTYHGPGQLVMYVLLNLSKRNLKDIKLFIYNLEQLVIDTLAFFNIKGERRKDRVGIWVVTDNNLEAKIAAIGIRIRHWITFHGISININPNLNNFKGIVPCGIGNEYGVASFESLNFNNVTLDQVCEVVQQKFKEIFDEKYPYISI